MQKFHEKHPEIYSTWWCNFERKIALLEGERETKNKVYMKHSKAGNKFI